MNVNDLIAALRGTPSRSKRLLHKAAADTIEALLADLKEAGECETACECCFHVREHFKGCNEVDGDCSICRVPCTCKDCDGSSKWKWRGMRGRGDGESLL